MAKISSKITIVGFCLQLLVLCIFTSLIEGRPRTLKKCGRRNSHMGNIVGGKDVQPGDYPWQVSIQEKGKNGFRHVCGGTILNEHYIVTAAHCIYHKKKPWMYEIYTGLHQLSKKSHRPAQKYKIRKIILNEDFDFMASHNDIALLRTKKPITIEGSSGYVNGICLPENNEDPTGLAIVAGWGHTKEGGNVSDVLKAVKVPIVPRNECFATYSSGSEDYNDFTFEIVDSQICAGTIGKDSCKDDSGGPLMQKNRRGIYILIGVLSFGIGCGREYPGVYTKVASYMEWLDKNMV